MTNSTRAGSVARLSVVMLLGGAVVGPAVRADPASALRCERAITKAYAKHFATRTKIVQKCKDAAVRRGTPADTVDCPTSDLDAKLDDANTRLTSAIASKCGGANRLCSVTDSGVDADEPLGDIGWAIGTCPDLEGQGCNAPVTHCGDIAACLRCITAEAADQGTGIAYDQLVISEFSTGSPVNACQAALGKASAQFLLERAKRMGTCWDKVERGDAGFVVPPGCPDTDTGTVARVSQAAVRAVGGICQACGAGGDGNSDQQCDEPVSGLSAAEIGFEPDCPDVVVPSSGRPCGHEAVTTLADVIDCVTCVAEYLTDCGGAASAPAVTPYPSGCALP